MISKVEATRAKEITQAIIDAYGKNPAEYDEVEQQALSAFAFGTVFTFFYEETKVKPGEFDGVMIGILNKQFLYEMRTAVSYFYFLIQCTDREFHNVMNAIIHKGIDGIDYLDEPEVLGENLHKLMAALKGEIGPLSEYKTVKPV